MIRKLVLLVVLFLVVSPLKVDAALNDSYATWDLDMNVVAHQVRNGTEHVTNLAMMRVNEKVAYCIEPGVVGDKDAWYSSSFDIKDTSLGNIDTKRLSLIGYYGYGYGSHNTKEYYMATQELIWRLMGVEDVWWTDKKYGGNIINIETHKNEILSLVNNYEVAPKFEFKEKYIVGDEITLSDKNNVLDGYEVKEGKDVRIEGNNIIIKVSDDTKFTLSRKNNGLKPIYYYKNGFQTIGTFEYSYDFEKEYEIASEYGKMIVDKYDFDTKSKTPVVKDASLDGAVYGIYDKSNNLLQKKSTNDKGLIVFDKLPKGTYVIKEITPSIGYTLSSTWYETYVSSNRFEVIYKSYEKIIENEITITKFFKENDNSLSPEQNIEFEIYDNEGNLYGKYKTNQDGIIKLVLPYGKYVLHQSTTKQGYDMVEDSVINVENKNENQEIKLINEKLKEEILEEPNDEPEEKIEKLPNTGKSLNFIPFILVQVLLPIIYKNEKQNSK